MTDYEKINFYTDVNKYNDDFTRFIRRKILDKHNIYKYFRSDKFMSYANDLFWGLNNDYLLDTALAWPRIDRCVVKYIRLFHPSQFLHREFDLKFKDELKQLTRYACIVYKSMIYCDRITLNKLINIHNTPFKIAINKLKRNKIVNEGFLLKVSMKQSGMF